MGTPSELINAALLRRGRSPLNARQADAFDQMTQLHPRNGVLDVVDTTIRMASSTLTSVQTHRDRVEGGYFDAQAEKEFDFMEDSYTASQPECLRKEQYVPNPEEWQESKNTHIENYRAGKLKAADATERTALQHLANAYYILAAMDCATLDIGMPGFRRLTREFHNELKDAFDRFRAALGGELAVPE